MDLFTTVLAAKAIQGVTQSFTRSNSEKAETPERSGADFDALLRGILNPELGNKINEEELYAGLLYERIHRMKGPEAAEQFQKSFESHKSRLTREDGYIWIEDAAEAALEQMKQEGVIDDAQYIEIRGQAFRAAQLDDNLDVLWDGRGSANDPTIAIEQLDVALQSARALLERMDAGEDVGNMPGISSDMAQGALGSGRMVTPNGTNIDGPGGFLWKPISESDGKLVVLLPANLAYQVADVILRDSDGNEIDRGRQAGYHNEGREHFRFSKSGRGYPDGVRVEVRFHDGSTRSYLIPDPSKRYD